MGLMKVLTFSLFSRGRFEYVAVDEEGSNGFGRSVSIRFLDRFVHIRVRHEVGRPLEVGVLIEAVGPPLLDSLLGPDVVRVLGQALHQLLQFGGERDVGQVERSWLVPVALEERVVVQPHTSNATRRLVQGDVVAESENGSAKYVTLLPYTKPSFQFMESAFIIDE